SIAMTYMMLAAEEQNLGCCWVQTHLRTDADGRDAEENVREILGLSEKYRVVGFLVLGDAET
ncbi:MAG: nitroreductase family protein, partial [Oscillospiraceae bacterium]|nr:nitroreductase family protein [Oscillospiraceae bacterium]